LEDVEDLLKQPDTLVLSCKLNLGTEFFLEKMWDYLGLVRVYTKKVSKFIHFIHKKNI